jgi:uncharacterized protein (DUF1501 family)
LGRDLAKVNSQDELDQLQKLRSGNSWVGLTDAAAEGSWVWADGSTPTFDLQWRKGEPNNWRGNNVNGENCAMLNNRKLLDNDCNSKQYFFCGASLGAPTPGQLRRATAIAQQLIVATPEFHSTSSGATTDVVRQQPQGKANPKPAAERKPYKAIVYLMLEGGADSYNMLIPHSECDTGQRDMYENYAQVRDDVALGKDDLLPITANVKSPKSKQVCSKFGLHPSIKHGHKQYEAGDTLWIANAGPLAEPANRHNWKKKRLPPQLFGHRSQQRLAMNVDTTMSRTNGVLGRMADALRGDGVGTGAYSINGQGAIAIETATTSTFDVLNRGGVTSISSKSEFLLPHLSNLTTFVSASPFAETWADKLNSTLVNTAEIKAAIKGMSTVTSFPATQGADRNKLADQLKQVATMMRANADSFNNERDIFFVSQNGFDAHSNVAKSLADAMVLMDSALESFEAEMRAQGLWDNVTLVQASDFGRTLTSNGDGTDHAWGGNYFLTGGAVRGGQILGDYPDDLSSEGEQILKRGRVIPTTPWEAVWAGVGEWFGVAESHMDMVLPNRASFKNFFSKEDLFKVSAQLSAPSLITISSLDN